MIYLKEVCCIGGRKFSSCKQSTRFPMEKYKHELNSVFSIDIAEDDPEVHPQYICILCQRALKRVSEKSTYCGGGCGTLVTWTQHCRASCSFCENQTSKSKGRPITKPKTKPRGVAQGITAQSTHNDTHMLQHAPTTDQSVTQASGLDVPAENVFTNATNKYQATLPLSKKQVHRY